jgi:hypothetical protein
MNRRNQIALAIVSITTCAAPITLARYVPQWFDQIDEIARRSDVIVIACPMDSKPCGTATNVIVTGCDSNDMEVTRIHYDVKTYPAGMNAFVPTETTFVVLSQLKGQLSTNSFTLLHYTWDKEFHRTNSLSRVNPPCLVSFTNTMSDAQGTKSYFVRPKYLMFLRKSDDGRFVATTGQFDPAYSVQLLEEDSYWSR